MKDETKFTKKVLIKLRMLPHSTWHKISQRSIRGTADVLGCCAGLYCEFEIKIEPPKNLKGREVLQALKLERANKSGGVGLFLHPGNWEDIYKKLKKRTDRWKPEKVML